MLSTALRGPRNGNHASGLHADGNSLFLTLCARALDNRSQHAILADVTADEIVRTLDYDYDQFHINTNLMINVALRAKKLDEVASAFIAGHPDAVGLDLGAGLDTRMIRIAPPSTVDWYDVDFPAVIAARERLIPARADAHGISADLTQGGWLDTVPSDRPAVIVAGRLGGVPDRGRDDHLVQPADQPLPQRRDRL